MGADSGVGSYFHFGNNCFFVKFAAVEDIFQVLADCRDFHAENLSHSFLGRPNGFGVGVGNYLYAGFAVLRIVKQKIRIGFNFICPSSGYLFFCRA